MVAHSTAYAPAIEQTARHASRRALIAERYAALRGFHHAPDHTSENLAVPFRPTPRVCALAAADAEPILSPHERARVRLDVAISRDGEEWQIGRAEPCRWLVLA